METKKEGYTTMKFTSNEPTGYCVTIAHFFVYLIGIVGFLGSLVVVGDIVCEMLEEVHHVDSRLDKMVAKDMKRSSIIMADGELERLSSLLFAMIYCGSSVFLIVAAMKSRSDLTVPWLICESIMFMTQMAIVLCPPFMVLPQIFAFRPEGFMYNAIILTVSLLMFADVAMMRVYWTEQQRRATLSTLCTSEREHNTRCRFIGSIEEVRAHLDERINMSCLLRKIPQLQLALVVGSPKGVNHGPQQIRTEA